MSALLLGGVAASVGVACYLLAPKIPGRLRRNNRGALSRTASAARPSLYRVLDVVTLAIRRRLRPLARTAAVPPEPRPRRGGTARRRSPRVTPAVRNAGVVVAV